MEGKKQQTATTLGPSVVLFCQTRPGYGCSCQASA